MKTISTKNELGQDYLQKVVEVLYDGGLVIYPTDTAYGLGVLASSKQGVDKLLEYKGAREGKAVSVAVSGRKMAKKYVDLNEQAEKLYGDYLPGAVTVISKMKGEAIGNGKEQIDERLISENQTLGIRIPDSEIVKQITEALGEGITATSANVSGGETPYSVESLLKSLPEEKKAMIDLVIDFDELPKVETSTIVDTTVEPMAVIRGNLPKVWKSNSEEETYEIAKEILEILERENIGTDNDKSVVLLLKGEMGAGKTQFVKGLAKALGIEQNVISPTFVLERQYEIPHSSVSRFRKLYHYDLWRVSSEDVSRVGEFIENLGIQDALKPGNIIAIEWPENVVGLREHIKMVDVILLGLEIGEKGKERYFNIVTRKFTL
ncbi:threonylcarbamoyl-AMP synthase [Candidatus Dojkabacteria bacterium]|nr:threonylcarbamoyl-AMP synthase [Candidatus Dojkabacteria bacterium]